MKRRNPHSQSCVGPKRTAFRTSRSHWAADERGPLPDLEIARKRSAYILFDSNVEKNDKVWKAREKFIEVLSVNLSADVWILTMPDTPGVNGPDDIFIAPDGDARFFRVFHSAEHRKFVTHDVRMPGSTMSTIVVPEYPAPMDQAAFRGIAGKFVARVSPESEADPVALLVNFLSAAGVLFGSRAYCLADGAEHYPVDYFLLVGKSGISRKGSSTRRMLSCFERVQEGFYKNSVLTSLSSNEGLIKKVSELEDSKLAKLGYHEKISLFGVLNEFAGLLSTIKREGNTLSSGLREIWDGGKLQINTRKDSLEVMGLILSLIAHITRDELQSGLTTVDRVNGFINRWILLCVKRLQLIPEGGSPLDFTEIAVLLNEALANPDAGRGMMPRDRAAKELWAAQYPILTRERDGMKAALCGRAEAHVLRLSLLYALLDTAKAINVSHLESALAIWDYAERSIDYLFADCLGDPDAQRILDSLANGPMTANDFMNLFGRNRKADWIARKLAALVSDGRIETCTVGNIRSWRRK